MSCSDVKVSCPSFKWWTFVLLFLPLILYTIFQTASQGMNFSFFWFYHLNFFFSNEMLTIFGWIHVRLTTIGALRIVLTIEALVIFLTTLKTFKFSFTLALTMSEYLTLKASYWIRDIWTDFNIVSMIRYWENEML